ncbi:MAG TPA: lysylphosphatidylglycerol synthase domain-containing protein, partial [Pirellulaceae bacterium]|nr:lysylphosphatidylglycerol synthase domain-containing protein [Pirellulaceae bacterium]
MGRLRKLITSTIVAVVFCAAIVMLYRQLQHYSYQDIVQSLRSIPTGKLLLAVALTGVNYLVLGVYDLLALRAIGRPMPLRQVALAAIVGYAASFNFGALLGGSAVRYRFYSAWGLSTADILHLLAMIGVVFWIGMFALAGTVFVITPVEAPPDLNLPFTSTRPLGTVLLTIAVAYLAATAIRREPVKIRNWEVSLPSPGLSAAQLAVASADLLVAAAILFVLLPAGVSAGYGSFIGIYLLAVTAVVLTHVPGGVGVFELVVLTMLDPEHPDQVMGSLIAFRFIYYLLPLGIAGGLLGSFELTQGRSLMKRLSAASERLSPALVPRVMAILTLIGGGVLLLANAVPVIPSRLDWLGARVPLLVIEAAHVIGSLAGVVLLLMGYSLQRRSLGGYWLAVTLLAIGILSCLVRGLDIEEASILLALLLALIPTRRYFMRPGVLLSDLPRPAWLVAVSLVLLTVTTLGAFVHRRVVYSSGLWWQFGIDAEASRFLRMTLGTSLVVAAVAVARFLRQPRIVMALPSDSQLRDAAKVLKHSMQSQVTTAQLPGKHLMLDEQRRAVILFDAGPTNWIVLGDPVGDTTAGRELAWRFSDLADRGGRTPAFYDVGGDH